MSSNQITDSTLLHESFTVTQLIADKYDRVSRVKGSNPDLAMHLDVNHDLFPVAAGESLEIVLATTLSLDGTSDLEKAKHGWRDIDEGGTLADGFDYVCYGKIYRFEEMGADSIKVFISFGGLLFMIEGSAKKLTTLKHEYVYLLAKKV